MFNGKTHYKWSIFNSYVTNYQRVFCWIPNVQCFRFHPRFLFIFLGRSLRGKHLTFAPGCFVSPSFKVPISVVDFQRLHVHQSLDIPPESTSLYIHLFIYIDWFIYIYIDIYIYTMWGPPVISWFRFAPVTIVINPINHSWNWSYVNPNLAIERGPHIVYIYL